MRDALAQHRDTASHLADQKKCRMVIGVAELVDTPNLSRSDPKANFEKHRVPEDEIGADFKHNTAWVLRMLGPSANPSRIATLPARLFR